MRKITYIPKINPLEKPKLKVAAYARVSHQHLLNSLSNQGSYYSALIQQNSEWEYKGVYADVAVSGREGTRRKE